MELIDVSCMISDSIFLYVFVEVPGVFKRIQTQAKLLCFLKAGAGCVRTQHKLYSKNIREIQQEHSSTDMIRLDIEFAMLVLLTPYSWIVEPLRICQQLPRHTREHNLSLTRRLYLLSCR